MAVSERFQGANTLEAGRLSPYWGEHAARYIYALPFVEQKIVLDIACGTGYGLSMLKSSAKHIVGVDVDFEAAKTAVEETDERTSVILGDGLSLPFADGQFDVITSFETLEHIHDRNDYLAELKRVLRNDGVLILSTPNANYTMPVNGKPSNPFHVFEYSPAELRTELDSHFRRERFLGQTLSSTFQIPPFQDAQRRLPKDLQTQVKLFAWRVFNKLPLMIREVASSLIWNKPFYPTEMDYDFSEANIDHAPVLVAVCHKS